MSVSELFQFLTSDRLNVRNEASEIGKWISISLFILLLYLVLGLTLSDENLPFFMENENKAIFDLMTLTKDEAVGSWGFFLALWWVGCGFGWYSTGSATKDLGLIYTTALIMSFLASNELGFCFLGLKSM